MCWSRNSCCRMTGWRLTPDTLALWPQTAPLLTDNNTATLVHGANGQSTALETPGGGAPSAGVAAKPTPRAASPTVGPMPLGGGAEGENAGPMSGQALLDVISLSGAGFGRKLLRGARGART